MVTNIFFDLDGTIMDSEEGIIRAIQYAVAKNGLDSTLVEDYRVFIGPPLRESFQRYFSLDEASAQEAVAAYREYYSQRGIFQGTIYDGLEEALQELSQTYTLSIATSKPEIFAERILTHFNLTRYFKGIYGATMDTERTLKEQVIAYALRESKATPTATVMIGDREHDILGAKANGLKSIGVLYGFGSESELQEGGADKIVAQPSELLSAINTLEEA
jgi:Predicted phosphatases